MPTKSKRHQKLRCAHNRSECPITNTLDLLGDKWTLLVIRDMHYLKKKTFNGFLGSPEGIATNILTDRLKRLEDFGIITKKPYTTAPLRYRYTLTHRGRDLKRVLLEMIRWGNKHIEGTWVPPKKLIGS